MSVCLGLLEPTTSGSQLDLQAGNFFHQPLMDMLSHHLREKGQQPIALLSASGTTGVLVDVPLLVFASGSIRR